MPANKKDHIAYQYYLNIPFISIGYGSLGNQCQHCMEMDQFYHNFIVYIEKSRL